MAVTTSTTPSREPATRSAPASSKDLGGAASEHVASRGEAAEAGGDMLQTASRMIYSGSYALAYGLVYATVFVVQMLPQDNPMMHGFHDGGKAAMDELSQS